MQMPEFESKISLGAIVQTALLIIGFALAWGKLATREEVDLKISAVKNESVTKDVNTLQIQLITNQLNTLAGQVQEVRSDVKDIKRAVRQ